MQIPSLSAISELMNPQPAATAAAAASPSTASNAAASSSSSTAGAVSSTDALGNESTFLQLLVAQIQNQDPTAPMDSSTFLTQLAEFSQVEQLIGIRQDVAELDPAATTSTTTTGSTSGS
jgi:flagellar basal-body rod modification protein FlgD